tara:strand:+ start:3562 stop:3900 length:339 start_codon:yes stop_codon:yes gene_type:complete
MNWQSLLKTFVFNEFENTSVQLVKEWEESLLEVMELWDESQGGGYALSLHRSYYPDGISTLTQIYTIILEEIRQTEEFLGWDFNADEIRFFETYLKGLEQLKEDMEWNFGDN